MQHSRRCGVAPRDGDDGEDASNIYAITDPATEHKGLLIDAFDVFHEICPRLVRAPCGASGNSTGR